MKDLVDYFDSCRVKRNIPDYNIPDLISESEADEILNEARKFMEFVLIWLKNNYPEYLEE